MLSDLPILRRAAKSYTLTWALAVAAAFAFSAPADAAANIQPHLTLAVNQQSDPTVFRGWPILFTLEILRSDSWQRESNINEFVLIPGPLGWTNSVRLAVTNGAGSPVSWPVELVGDTNGPVTIEWRRAGKFRWWIHPEQSMALPEGEYTVGATLDTQVSIAGWTGKTNSPAARVRIVEEPPSLSPDQTAEKFIALAHHSFWTGKTNEAAGFLNELLAQAPTNITALSMQGDLKEATGNLNEALEFRARALQQFYLQNPDAAEPPVDLVRKHRASLANALVVESAVLIVRREGAELVVEWNATPGLLYRLETSNDLRNWTTLRDGLSATDKTILTRLPFTDTVQFLRVAR